MLDRAKKTKASSVKEPSGEYRRNSEIPTLFGKPILAGKFEEIDLPAFTPDRPVRFYSHPHCELWLGDSIIWLKTLPDESVDLIFADPPYNIRKAEWDNFESQEVYIDWSIQWISEASRILKPTGTLYICGFSEILADLKHPASKYFKGCRWIIWHYKNKANLGSDWGRSHESIIHFRKGKKFTFNVFKNTR